MLDGIDYYPKRKKRLILKLFQLFLLILILLGIWYYFEDVEISGSQPTSIIISEPNNFESSEESIAENIEEVTTTPIIGNNTESLDETIRNYEASTQN
jgi:cell division septal protein FtsQ